MLEEIGSPDKVHEAIAKAKVCCCQPASSEDEVVLHPEGGVGHLVLLPVFGGTCQCVRAWQCAHKSGMTLSSAACIHAACAV